MLVLKGITLIKCVRCGKRLTKKYDEYFHNKCCDEQMKEEHIKMLAESKENRNLAEELEDYSMEWRFKDNRGRSVFKNE